MAGKWEGVRGGQVVRVGPGRCGEVVGGSWF